jgi:hypothetical protein
MHSPFPGMDPYLEQPGRWRGFHVTFLTSLMASLNKRLPAPDTADIEESPDADFLVSLQDVFQQAYDAGADGRTLDYSAPPGVRFRGGDADWVIDTARRGIPA